MKFHVHCLFLRRNNIFSRVLLMIPEPARIKDYWHVFTIIIRFVVLRNLVLLLTDWLKDSLNVGPLILGPTYQDVRPLHLTYPVALTTIGLIDMRKCMALLNFQVTTQLLQNHFF